MIIHVRVKINATKADITKVDESTYEVKVDEKAIDGRANRRLIEILSKHFAVSKSRIIIINGSKSRDKIVDGAID